MPKASLRLALLSFASLGLFVAPVLAQDAPPVSDPPPESSAPGSSIPAAPPARLPDEPGVVAPDAPAAPAEPEIIPIPAVWSPSPRDAQGRTAYGLYLSGRYLAGRSLTEGDGAQGASDLSAVQALTPEQPLVREQAFTAALLAGDLDDAARIAPSGPGVQPVISEAGRLVAVVQSFAHGDARAALAPLKTQPIRAPHARAAVLVMPWIAASAGDWDFALTEPTPGATDLFTQVLRFQRAQLLETRRRFADADAEYKALTASPFAQAPFRLGYGAFLERRNRRDEAVALYDRAIAGGAMDVQTRLARDRALAGGRPPAAQTLREGAATALTLAANLAASDGAPEFAAVYIRLALNVSPSDEMRLLLGATLVQAKLESAARDAFGGVPERDSEAYATARTQRALSWARDKNDAEALADLRRAAAAAPTNRGIAYFLASQLVQMHLYDEALSVLNGPVLSSADQGPDVRFVRGAAYEATGRVAEAEAELWAALQAQPDEPAFLNYLGYLWVDNGTRVAEGAEMIGRAHVADPNDGNIQDSLGWAQYRQGQYDAAVDTLEQAVDKEPANAEINDHLGDAYWQVGRRREAGFQWNRVLTLDPDAERRADVEKKLTDGLDASTPASPVGQP